MMASMMAVFSGIGITRKDDTMIIDRGPRLEELPRILAASRGGSHMVMPRRKKYRRSGWHKPYPFNKNR